MCVLVAVSLQFRRLLQKQRVSFRRLLVKNMCLYVVCFQNASWKFTYIRNLELHLGSCLWWRLACLLLAQGYYNKQGLIVYR